ncbi:MAG: hypothetical protein QOD45_484 [Pseudonocardiales bacterium]|nr:hypothetical protein [Pseudonocardiales bacterium]
MPPRSTQRRLVLLTAGLSAVPLLIPGAAVAAPVQTVAYSGVAYGSTVHLGNTLQSGRTSVSSICTGDTGATNSNSTAATTIPGVGTIGAVSTSVSSTTNGTNPESVANSQTSVTDLFGGLVHADAIKATSQIQFNGTGYPAAGNTTLVNATVAGVAIAFHPTRNQTIALPGVGTLVLNHQSGSQTDLLHSWNVTAMTITITATNTLGLPPGVIVISSATASLHEPLYRRPYGDAYGTTVNLGNGTLYSGKTAFVSLPCGGSDGRLITNNVAVVSLPSVLTTGAVVTSATSSDTASVTTANTHSQIANVSLASGAVTATTLTATANASRNSSGITFPGSGATFVNLVIAGVPFSGTPPPNTTITIPLVGTLKLNVITTTSTGVQVYAMQLVLSAPLGALPTGAKITVAAAHAGVYNR